MMPADIGVRPDGAIPSRDGLGTCWHKRPPIRRRRRRRPGRARVLLVSHSLAIVTSAARVIAHPLVVIRHPTVELQFRSCAFNHIPHPFQKHSAFALLQMSQKIDFRLFRRLFQKGSFPGQRFGCSRCRR
jgi:hypothetical protein